MGNQSGNHAHNCGLACTVGTNKGDYLSLGNGKGHTVYHGFSVILFCQLLYMHDHTFFLVKMR